MCVCTYTLLMLCIKYTYTLLMYTHMCVSIDTYTLLMYMCFK